MGEAEIKPRWIAPPFIKASAALHVVSAAALVASPATWPWVIGALVANHAGITAAGLWPRSTLLGPNITRLSAAAVQRNEIALTFDDGPDPEVTPRVLDLLDAHNAKGTFFCIGTHAAQHPQLVREIIARGHDVENHSQDHPVAFSFYGVARFKRELAVAQQTLAELTGQAPRFFRAPAGLRNPMLDPALHALGLRLVSWTRRGFDGVSGDAEPVYARLTRNLAAGDILVLHDGRPPRTADGVPVPLVVLPRLLDCLAQCGLRTVTLAQGLA